MVMLKINTTNCKEVATKNGQICIASFNVESQSFDNSDLREMSTAKSTKVGQAPCAGNRDFWRQM